MVTVFLTFVMLAFSMLPMSAKDNSNEASSKEAYIQDLTSTYNSKKINDVVELDDGYYKIIERLLIIDNDNYLNSYVDTKYQKIGKSKGYVDTGEYAASQDHRFSNSDRVVTATVYAVFSYSTAGDVAPSVVSKRYNLSDTSCMRMISLDETTNIFTKTQKVNLSYSITYGAGNINSYSVDVGCKPNGFPA